MTPRDAVTEIIQLLTATADESGDTMQGVLSPRTVRALGEALEALAKTDTTAAQLLSEALSRLEKLRWTDEQKSTFARPHFRPWDK